MEATEPYFKLKPYGHQYDSWIATRDMEGFGLFWEMGVGKSCAIIGTTSWLYRKNEIDTLIVIAPNGVHANWTNDEIPNHLPDDLQLSMKSITWESGKSGQKGKIAEFKEAVKHDGLVVVVMNYEAVLTDRGAKALKQLLTKRKCLYVLDEAGRIKTPGSRTTKRILASSKYAKYRRTCTGTPVDGSPFDVYAQVRFVREDIWKGMGISNFGTFKVRYGLWEKRFNHAQGREFDVLTRYCNLTELKDVVDKVGSRLLKVDVLDLPKKIYTKRYFNLDPTQRKVYTDLDKKFIAWLESGESVTADLQLTRMLRMQQIASGFTRNDDEAVVPVGKNVRLAALKDVMEDVHGPVIIWTRWSWELDEIRAWLGEDDAVYYDGRTTPDQREDAKRRFQREGTARFFVAKASAAGRGLTLHRAKTMIYVTNTYSLEERLQSEDRFHRAGMNDEPVTIIDLIAKGTYDDKQLQSLRGKRDMAIMINGDQYTSWI